MAAGGDHNALGHRVVLRLGQHVRGQNPGVGAAVGNGQHLAGACKKVDSHLAVALPLGLGHILVARPHNHVHRLDLLCAVGQGGDSLGAAHRVDLIRSGDVHGRQRLVVGGVGPLYHRGTGGHPGHPRRLGRDNQHQGRGEQGIGAPGHVAAAGGNGDHPMPQDGVLHVGEMVQPGQALPLGQGKAADVVGRPVQVIQLLPGQLLAGRVDFCPGYPQRGAGAAVKAGAVLRQGGVPPGPDVPDNPGYAAAALLRLLGRAGGRLLQKFHR